MTDEPAERYPYFGAPPARIPRPAVEEPTLRGKRMILSMPDGFVYDMRAVSEIYVQDGAQVVDIVGEEDYFRWMFTGVAPTRRAFPRKLIWVE